MLKVALNLSIFHLKVYLVLVALASFLYEKSRFSFIISCISQHLVHYNRYFLLCFIKRVIKTKINLNSTMEAKFFLFKLLSS